MTYSTETPRPLTDRRAWERAWTRWASAETRAQQAHDDRRAFYVDAGYTDPVGAEAARNLDSANVAELLRERWAGARHEFA